MLARGWRTFWSCRWLQAGIRTCMNTLRGARTGFCGCCRNLNPTPTGHTIEDLAMAAAAGFYSVAQVLFAPNPDSARCLNEHRTDVPPDATRAWTRIFFHPSKRRRDAERPRSCAGVCGKAVCGEKMWRCWRRCRKTWKRWAGPRRQVFVAGVCAPQEFQIPDCGAGRRGGLAARAGCREWSLRECCAARRSPRPTRTWICCVFLSHTDTFGNVVLEALASGVPAIVDPRTAARERLCAMEKWDES